ncbi:hypothetical protein ACXR2U_22555 [Jatrophihabitans sp. YIM 134969]
MTDDDFERSLRARLGDLAAGADHDLDWDDPLPEARRRAALPDPDPAEVVPIGAARSRRRLLPGLAVAAVVLAVLVGGGFGVRELVRNTGVSASSAAGQAAAGGDAGAESAPPPEVCVSSEPTGCPAASSRPTSGVAAGPGAPGPAPGGTDTAGCATQGAATSNGPLAGIAAIRPNGITGSRATAGGSAGIPYQLTFGRGGGTAELRAARAVWVQDGQLCAATGTVASGAISSVPVEPGAGVNGSSVFAAVDSRGEPLPAGEYLAVIVIPYRYGGSAMSQLVSTPVTVTVTP